MCGKVEIRATGSTFAYVRERTLMVWRNGVDIGHGGVSDRR